MNNNYNLIKNTEWKEVEINGEVKEIPMDWEVVAFNHFGLFKTGKDYKKNIGNKYNIYGSSSIPMNTKSNSIIYDQPTFILGRKGTIDKPFKVNEPFWCVDTALYFHFNGINKQNFLYYQSKTIDWYKYNSGSTVPSLVQSTVNKIELFKPSEYEQSAITNILSTQEAIIQDIESLISKYESRFQYLSEELLSGRLRVKEVDEQTILYKNADSNWKEVEINGEITDIPKDWKVDKLVSFTKLIKGVSIPENKTNYEGKGIKYLKTTELWMDSSSKRTTAYAEDGYSSEHLKTKDEYVISFDGFNTEVGKGTVGLVTCEGIGIISTHFFKIEKNPYYYFSVNLLRTDKVQHQIVKNAEGSISLSSTKFAKSMEIQKPKLTEEMILISDFLAPNHNLIQDKKELLSKEKQKFDWLLDNLLSGKYIVQNQ